MLIRANVTKRCPRCGETKPAAGNFYLVKRPAGTRFAGYCIPCTKAAAVAHQKANPEKKREYDAATVRNVKADPERSAHRSRQHKDRWAAYMREWRLRPETREKYLADQRAAQIRYKRRDPERMRIHNAISNNSRRARKLGLPDTFRGEHWRALLAAFDNRCAYCGADRVQLDIDHLLAIGKGGGNAPGNVVPACRICNSQKHTRTLEEFSALRDGLDCDRIRELAARVM